MLSIQRKQATFAIYDFLFPVFVSSVAELEVTKYRTKR